MLIYLLFFLIFYIFWLIEEIRLPDVILFHDSLFFKINVIIFSLLPLSIVLFFLKIYFIPKKCDELIKHYDRNTIVLSIVTFLLAMFFMGIWSNNYKPESLFITRVNNINKADEIQKIINTNYKKYFPHYEEPPLVSIQLYENEYHIILNHYNEREAGKIMVLLAENNFIDDNFIKVKDKDFKKIDLAEFSAKKLVERIIKNKIKFIDGVKKVKVQFIPPSENNKSKFIIDVEIFDDFNQEKIKSTINNLLYIYSDSEKIINIEKSNYFINKNWIKNDN